MIKEYYFNKDFLKLLKLDHEKSYALETIYNKLIKEKIINKKVEKKGRYGISKFYYFNDHFRKKLEKIRKNNNLGRRQIRRKFKSSYSRNFLWCFVKDQDLKKFEYSVCLNESDFNFVNTLVL
jgi:hypothetical protein